MHNGVYISIMQWAVWMFCDQLCIFLLASLALFRRRSLLSTVQCRGLLATCQSRQQATSTWRSTQEHCTRQYIPHIIVGDNTDCLWLLSGDLQYLVRVQCARTSTCTCSALGRVCYNGLRRVVAILLWLHNVLVTFSQFKSFCSVWCRVTD